MRFKGLLKKREAKAVTLREQSLFRLKSPAFRALERPLLFQPDASASGYRRLPDLLAIHIEPKVIVGSVSHLMSLMNKLKNLGVDTIHLYSESMPSRSAAALAYRSIFSLAPLLLISVMVLGIFIGRETAGEQVNSALETVLDAETAAVVESWAGALFSRSGRDYTLASFVGIGILLYAASALFKELKIALHSVWGLPPVFKKGLLAFIITQVTAISMVLLVGFFFLLLFFINVVVSLLDTYIFQGELIALQWGSFLGSVLVTALLIGLLYRLVPDVSLPWSDLWVGALVTTTLMMVGLWGINIYLNFSNLGWATGTAGAIILLLVWCYYAAQVFLFGASFAGAYAKNFGSKKASQELGLFDSDSSGSDSREDK